MINKKTTPRTQGEISFISNELLEIFGDRLTSVVLFGSYARKNNTEDSDMDIIAIVDEYNNEDISSLRRSFLMAFERKLDLHVFTKEQIVENFRTLSPMFVTLLLGKRVLFDRNCFFSEQYLKFIKKMSNQKIKYCEGGKIWEMQKVAQNLKNSL